VRQIEQFGLLAKTGFPDSKAHFSVLALQDFCLQRRVGLDPLAEGGKFDRLWHQPCQQHAVGTDAAAVMALITPASQ
jgi:hypothetical protein